MATTSSLSVVDRPAVSSPTAPPDPSVLLIEAGPNYGSDSAVGPDDLLCSSAQALELHTWGLHDAKSGIFFPRARVLGGQSAVNACNWIRGSAANFNAGDAFDNLGWLFEGLLPYFRIPEFELLGAPVHGSD